MCGKLRNALIDYKKCLLKFSVECCTESPFLTYIWLDEKTTDHEQNDQQCIGRYLHREGIR